MTFIKVSPRGFGHMKWSVAALFHLATYLFIFEIGGELIAIGIVLAILFAMAVCKKYKKKIQSFEDLTSGSRRA
jgi:hypothetical protein